MSNDKMRERFEAWHETRRVNIISEADRITAEKIADGWSDSVVTSAESTYEAIEKITGNNSSFVPFQAGWQAALEHKPDTGLLGSLGKNWTEDASHENGNYTNKCNLCDSMFLGHKRRVICKECAVQLNPPYLLKYRKDPAMWNEDILHKPEVSQPVETWQERAKLANDFPCLSGDTVAKYMPEENKALKLRVTELEAESRTKHEYAMQMLGERDRLQSECDRLRDAAKQALLALHYHTEQTRPIDTSFGAMNALNAALMPAQKEQEK